MLSYCGFIFCGKSDQIACAIAVGEGLITLNGLPKRLGRVKWDCRLFLCFVMDSLGGRERARYYSSHWKLSVQPLKHMTITLTNVDWTTVHSCRRLYNLLLVPDDPNPRLLLLLVDATRLSAQKSNSPFCPAYTRLSSRSPNSLCPVGEHAFLSLCSLRDCRNSLYDSRKR